MNWRVSGESCRRCGSTRTWSARPHTEHRTEPRPSPPPPASGFGSSCKRRSPLGRPIHTDDFSGYNGLAALGYDHRPRSQRAAPPGEQLLPRAHRAVSNLKAWLHGTHRGVGNPHLQVYLDEYVFRHNRRRTAMAAFQTLLGLSSLHKPTTYAQITQRGTATA
jgi:ISXO2-like transposase domain